MTWENSLVEIILGIQFLFIYIAFNLGKTQGTGTTNPDGTIGQGDSFGFSKWWQPIRLLFFMGALILILPLISLGYFIIDAQGVNIPAATATKLTHVLDVVYRWIPMLIYFIIAIVVLLYLFSVIYQIWETSKRTRRG